MGWVSTFEIGTQFEVNSWQGVQVELREGGPFNYFLMRLIETFL